MVFHRVIPLVQPLVKYIFIYIPFSSSSKPAYLAAKTRLDITFLCYQISQIYTKKVTNLCQCQQGKISQIYTMKMQY